MIFLKRAPLFPIALLLVLAFTTSCDSDFNTIGGKLIGGQFDSIPLYKAGVTAYSNKIGPVQTNGLPSNLLGVYKEPVYGNQVANVLTQLSLPSADLDPEFGTNPIVDSVVLTLPYYSTVVETGDDGNPIYRLDSIYGGSPYKLTVTRSNFFLNDFDPEANFETAQKYYSDQGPLFQSNLVGDALYTNENFIPSVKEVVYEQFNDQNELDTVRVSPRLRVNLTKEFFQQNILDKQGSTELTNNNNFRNFIRGLYFKAEPVNDNGNMLLLDFNSITNTDAGITIYYHSQVEDGEGTAMEPASYKLNFGPNTVNTFSQDFPGSIASEIAGMSPEIGAENLFLKGGEGAVSVIELFEDEAELAELRANNWLINEANLVFYVNQDKVEGGSSEPENIYLYNLDTYQPVTDYYVISANGSLTQNPSHAPALEREDTGNGIKYKIRITEHIKKVLNNDSTNVRLGLVVTQNSNLVSNSALKSPVDGMDRIPRASVMTPKGTVLHGNLSPNIDKRLQFNIYYTETNN